MNDKYKQIFTIPNLLSVFRLMLIPVIIWLYCSEERYSLAVIVVLVSGLSDTVDGFIARRFNMVTDVGKVLDPAADKLTQAAMIFCLLFRFPAMLALLLLLVVKELTQAGMGLAVMKKTGNVYSAKWYGKLCTWVLYAVMIVHMAWPDIPTAASHLLIVLCAGAMLLSLSMYMLRYIKLLREGGNKAEDGK